MGRDSLRINAYDAGAFGMNTKDVDARQLYGGHNGGSVHFVSRTARWILKNTIVKVNINHHASSCLK